MAESDVSRPSALPTANLRLRGAQTLSQPTNAGIENEHDSEAYLDAFEEDWNKRIDSEMDVLVEGMTDLVSLAQIGDKDKFRVGQEAFQAQCRAESMVRAAQSLISIAHSMKLLLLLSDETQIANRRDAELKLVRSETDATKKEVEVLLDDLLGKTGE